MKKLILLLILTVFIACCNKDDNKPIAEIDKLPQATQIGANKAGCLVNGIAFLPKGYFVTGNLNCVYQDQLNFSLAIVERLIEGSKDQLRSINIASLNQNLVENQTYLLKESGLNDSKYAEYTFSNEQMFSEVNYSTTSTITGELKITHHDYINAIISGTFWFDAINSEGTKVEVREGRFDMHY